MQNKGSNSMKKFTINIKKFKGQYYNIIRDTLKYKYSELYPGQKIEIEYNRQAGGYNFFVYVYMKVFSPEGGIALEKTLITFYDNITAINLFSNISMDKYLEEYDDSKKDYIQELTDELTAIIVSYKLLGLEPKNIEINSKIVSIYFHNSSNWNLGKIIVYHFNYDILTKEEKDKCVRYVKSQYKKICNL